MEGKSPAYQWGFVIGALVGLVLCIVLVKVLLSGKRGCKRQYDERQQLAIAKGYKCGYYTLLIYISVLALFDLMTGIRWCSVYTGAFIGVLISVGVFGVICIKNDAYLPLQQSPRRYITLFLTLGVINVAIGAAHYYSEGTFLEDGMLSHSVVNPLVGVLLLVLAMALAFKTQREQHMRETE